MVCPKCGDVVFQGAVFCVRCGAMLAGTRPEEPDTPAAGSSNSWLKVAVGIFVVIAAVVVLVSLSLGRSGEASVRYVPDVVGMSRADADAKLAKAGFECVIGGEQLSSTTDTDAVISQWPRPDTPTSRKQVRVVLSVGPDVSEPEVARRPQQAAVRTPRPSTTASTRSDATAKDEKPAQQRQAVSSKPRARQTAAATSLAIPQVSSGPGYGSVAIEAQPDDWEVWVYVDGGPARGKCPTTIRLSAGEHSLVLWEPRQQKKVVVPVTVKPGQTLAVSKNLEESV